MFVKLFNAILDSSIADDRRLRHFFTDLLLCADSKGFVLMTDSAIARRIGATVEEVQWGLSELSKPDPKSKTPDREGRRIETLKGHGYGWRVINFESYRALRDADQMREATRQRVRRFRERKGHQTAVGNADVTQGNGGNAIEKEKESKRENKKKDKEGSAFGAEVVALWNSLEGFAKVKALAATRRSHLKARLEDSYFASEYPNAMLRMASCPFLCGKNDRGWVADFDWFIKPDSVAKIMEGKYDDRKGKQDLLIGDGDSIGGRKGSFKTI
jgi:hypothetical protein